MNKRHWSPDQSEALGAIIDGLSLSLELGNTLRPIESIKLEIGEYFPECDFDEIVSFILELFPMLNDKK